MEFTATELPNGKFMVHAIPERKPNGDLVMHVPSFSTISSLVKKAKKDKK